MPCPICFPVPSLLVIDYEVSVMVCLLTLLKPELHKKTFINKQIFSDYHLYSSCLLSCIGKAWYYSLMLYIVMLNSIVTRQTHHMWRVPERLSLWNCLPSSFVSAENIKQLKTFLRTTGLSYVLLEKKWVTGVNYYCVLCVCCCVLLNFTLFIIVLWCPVWVRGK